MLWKKIFIFYIVSLFWIKPLLSCHKGGPMGFATNDPGSFSLDITLSPTYTGASTLGSLGCKNWDYAQTQKHLFLQSQWSKISEEASQGKGKHLIALANIMGCDKRQQNKFSILLHENYSALFGEITMQSDFLINLEILLSKDNSFSCSG